jgi:hypothetical protein
MGGFSWVVSGVLVMALGLLSGIAMLGLALKLHARAPLGVRWTVPRVLAGPGALTFLGPLEAVGGSLLGRHLPPGAWGFDALAWLLAPGALVLALFTGVVAWPKELGVAPMKAALIVLGGLALPIATWLAAHGGPDPSIFLVSLPVSAIGMSIAFYRAA